MVDKAENVGIGEQNPVVQEVVQMIHCRILAIKEETSHQLYHIYQRWVLVVQRRVDC